MMPGLETKEHMSKQHQHDVGTCFLCPPNPMGSKGRGPGGCHILSGFLSQPRNIELGEFTAFIVFGKQSYSLGGSYYLVAQGCLLQIQP